MNREGIKWNPWWYLLLLSDSNDTCTMSYSGLLYRSAYMQQLPGRTTTRHFLPASVLFDRPVYLYLQWHTWIATRFYTYANDTPRSLSISPLFLAHPRNSSYSFQCSSLLIFLDIWLFIRIIISIRTYQTPTIRQGELIIYDKIIFHHGVSCSFLLFTYFSWETFSHARTLNFVNTC